MGKMSKSCIEENIPKSKIFQITFLFQAQEKSICELKCSEEPTEHVCGDDNLNYRNQCELRQASLCDGKNVKKLHRGKCFDAEYSGRKLF